MIVSYKKDILFEMLMDQIDKIYTFFPIDGSLDLPYDAHASELPPLQYTIIPETTNRKRQGD